MKIIIDGIEMDGADALSFLQDALKPKKPLKKFGVVTSGRFIERLSTNEIDYGVFIWDCVIWRYKDGVISNPIPAKIPQAQAEYRKVRRSCIFYGDKIIPCRKLGFVEVSIKEN